MTHSSQHDDHRTNGDRYATGRTRPARLLPLHPARRLAAVLLAIVVALAIAVLLVSTWLRDTVFTADWYRPVLSDQAFLDQVRTAAVSEITAQGGRIGIPADVLTHGLDNAQISAYLNRYLDRFVDFLNYRGDFEAPDLSADIIATPLVAYARDLAARIGLTLTAAQEDQIRSGAREIARFVQNRLTIMTDTGILQSPAFKRWHGLLYTASRLAQPAAIVLAAALVLLLLVLFDRFGSFLRHAAAAAFLSAGAVFLTVAAVKSAGLSQSLTAATGTFRRTADELANRALDSLMQRSLVLLAVALIVLLLSLILLPRARLRYGG